MIGQIKLELLDNTRGLVRKQNSPRLVGSDLQISCSCGTGSADILDLLGSNILSFTINVTIRQ